MSFRFIGFCCALLFCASHVVADTGRQGQELFPTAEEALAEMKEAVVKRDTKRMIEIFGDKSKVFFETGDIVSDKMFLGRMAVKLQERAELMPVVSKEYPEEQWYKIRYGIESWPMRVPLVNRGKGWSFGVEYLTEKALRFRRELNEIVVVDTLRALVKAQHTYKSKDRNGDGVPEFTTKFLSSEGKQDGLYWKTAPEEEGSPLEGIIAQAMFDGYELDSKNRAYEGYIYRVLTEQGRKTRGGARSYLDDQGRLTKGFLILAYPRVWQSSGDATYIINHEGLIWKKDLLFRTADIAADMTAPDIDSSWAKPNPMVADMKSRVNW